jgi:hypothetical protein
VAAFDSVVREVVMGARMAPEALRARLAELSLDADVIEAIVSYVRDGDVLQRAGVPEELADLVRAVHASTWFASRGCTSLALTLGGSRAGNPLGDLLFNLVAAGLFRTIRGRLAAAGLTVPVPMVAAVSMLEPPPPEAVKAVFSEVSYLDDAAFAVQCPKAADVIAAVPQLVSCVVGTCREFGFELNFKEAKSEAIVSLTGPLSRSLRRQLFVHQKGLLECKCADRVVQLRVVPCYVHLGGVVHADGSLGPEFANRAAQANGAYMALSRKVFGRADVQVGTKLKAVRAFVESRLLYNAATWQRARTYAPLEAVRRRVFARVLGVKLEDHVADRILWAAAGTLPVEAVIRGRRLLYLAKVLTVAPPELWYLVASGSQASSSWAGLIRDDLCWLREQHISFLALPSPVLGLSPWMQFVVDDVGRWSRRVMQVQAEQVALLRTEVFAASLDPIGDAKLASALLRRLGPVGGGTDADDDRTVAELAALYAFGCELCDCRFQSARLLGVHKKFHHGLVSEARLFASGTLCRICQVEFHALPRLVRHLQRHHSCLSVWKDTIGPLDPAAREAAEAVVAAARRAARRDGTPFLAAFVPACRM